MRLWSKERRRPLNVDERRVMVALIRHGSRPETEALIRQLDVAQVVGKPCSCGCPTVDFDVDRSVAPVHLAARVLPNEVLILDDEGKTVGGVIVFLDDGYLSMMEVDWILEPITSLPPDERMVVRVRQTVTD